MELRKKTTWSKLIEDGLYALSAEDNIKDKEDAMALRVLLLAGAVAMQNCEEEKVLSEAQRRGVAEWPPRWVVELWG
jgi:hypothetical protein